MKDDASYAKAKADWSAAQERAHRRFFFAETRKAYLGVQSARITANVNIMERLEFHDARVIAVVFGDGEPAGVAVDSVVRNGPRWPYA